MNFLRHWQRLAAPCGTAAVVVHRSSCRNVEAQTASWESVEAYASDQATEYAAGRGPKRAPEIDERYRRFFQWASSRGQTGAEYMLHTAQWRGEHGGAWVALEPNIVPYELEAGVEHWNLWYHPATTPGSADLDLQAGAEVELVCSNDTGAAHHLGCIRSVRRVAYDSSEHYVVEGASGAVVTVGRADLRCCKTQGRWAAVLRHVRLFLPSLADNEVIIFQNIKELRSVPEIAHAHVFIRPRTKATADALRALRLRWRLSSPWAEAERLAGRGSEVGFSK